MPIEVNETTTVDRFDENCFLIDQVDGDGERHLVVFSLEDLQRILEIVKAL